MGSNMAPLMVSRGDSDSVGATESDMPLEIGLKDQLKTSVSLVTLINVYPADTAELSSAIYCKDSFHNWIIWDINERHFEVI